MSDLSLIQYWGVELTRDEIEALDLDGVRRSADDPDYVANRTYVSTINEETGVMHGHWYCRCRAWTRSAEQLAIHILRKHDSEAQRASFSETV